MPSTSSSVGALGVQVIQGAEDLEIARLRAAARLRLEQTRAVERYAQDLWAFLCDCVYTIDQVRGGWDANLTGGSGAAGHGDDQEASGRVLPLVGPAERAGSYLEFITKYWLKHQHLAIPKSRRMRMSWWTIAVHYWLARFSPGTKIAFVSRKEGRSESEGSAELVWRAKFIHDHIPPGRLPSIPIEYKFCRLAFPTLRSEILGVPQGADQLRQLTFTAIFGDEVAFWEHASAFYSATKPTLEGGGRMTLVSSAYPGFFEELVHDRF